MRGGALPCALLFAALGLAVAATSPPARTWSLLTTLVAALLLSRVPLPRDWIEIAFLGCWTSIVVTAAAVHLPRGADLRGALALSANAGLWAGAVAQLSGSPFDLLKALPALLIVLPAGWLVARRGSIAVKVASSWLIAIAILSATLPFLTVTPGYQPDHLD